MFNIKSIVRIADLFDKANRFFRYHKSRGNNSRNENLKKTEGFLEYFSVLAKEKGRLTIIICSCDNIGVKIPEQYADAILSLGLKTDLHRLRGLGGGSHRAFIAIMDGGNVIFEQLGKGGQKELTYTGNTYDITSTVYSENGCKDAKILIKDIDYCVNARGLNIVIIDRCLGEVIDSVNFDCFTDECKCKRVSLEEVKVHEEIKKNYSVFRNEYQAEELPGLALYRPSYPYGEVSVVTGCVGGGTLRNFCKRENLHFFNSSDSFVLSTLPMQIDRNGTKYIFSGITRWRDKLIFGVDDIQSHDIAIDELREGIGEFELLILKDDKLELSTDFFGMCQWYYYESENDVFVTATSYHLLLLTLKTIGIKMRLDTKKVAAGMALFSPFAQNSFTREMDIEGCYELSSDKRIVINPDKKYFFENTSLFEETHAIEPYSEEAYEKYLYQTKDEIIANVRAALMHPKFCHIICDLTGGIDSRTVIAAAMNLPHSLTQKIRAYSYPNGSDDLKFAYAIANAYGLKWDDIPVEISGDVVGLSNDMICQVRQSHDLGTYYAGPYMPIFKHRTHTIRLTGLSGEAIIRDFFSYIDYSKNEKYILANCGQTGSLDVSISTNAGKQFKQYVQNSILSMPGASLKEKLELWYLNYRYRHHCKTKYGRNEPTWAPLQSKTAFHCKLMHLAYHSKNPQFHAKFHYDLMSLLDPLLANFPYSNEKYNQYMIDMSDRLYRRGFPKAIVSPSYEPIAYERPQPEDSDKQRELNVCYKSVKEWYESEKTLLSALKVFLDYSDEFEELGLPLYKYFTNDRYKKIGNFNNHSDSMRINRLLSAYWQIKLIED